jgi:hypothetical protein
LSDNVLDIEVQVPGRPRIAITTPSRNTVAKASNFTVWGACTVCMLDVRCLQPLQLCYTNTAPSMLPCTACAPLPDGQQSRASNQTTLPLAYPGACKDPILNPTCLLLDFLNARHAQRDGIKTVAKNGSKETTFRHMRCDRMLGTPHGDVQRSEHRNFASAKLMIWNHHPTPSAFKLTTVCLERRERRR